MRLLTVSMSSLPSFLGRGLAFFVAVALLTGPAKAQVINEWVANHTGADTHEFIELLGSPNTDYSGLTLLVVEGDSTSDPGLIDVALGAGMSDGDGIWFTGFLNIVIENGSGTLLLVDGFSAAVGTDLDTDDNGTLDLTPWTALVDSIGVSDGGASDRTYAPVVLTPGFDGIVFTPGGASRVPDGMNTGSVSDWVRNDFEGAGLPGFTGNVGPNETANTPGLLNSTIPAPDSPPLISELVSDHVGADTAEFVEIFGSPSTNYAASSLLILEGDAGENPGQIDLRIDGGMTNTAGFWDTGFLADMIENGTLTVLLVDGFSGAVGDDLDGDDDGVLEVTPWTTLNDSVALSDAGAGDLTYSSTVLAPGFDTVATRPAGASRIPYGQDTDTAADWVRNDFDGEGLPGFLGSLASGEAINTPAMVNVVGVGDFYANVDSSSPTALRATLHAAIDDHVRFPYSASGTDTWDVLELADEDPANSANILDLYRNASYPKAGGGNANYNREHTWPRTYGFPDDNPGNYPFTDCHQLYLADIGYNSDRGSLAFGSCSAACSEDPTLVNNGQGGGTGVYPGNSNWFTGSGATGIWETWGARRGEIARAQFYLDVRYEGGTHTFRGAAEPDLILTDDTSLIVGGSNMAVAYMGRLATLLAWHLADPVDDLERARNEVVYRFQGNRNPFTDHPEWVECLFLGTGCLAPEIFADGFESGDTSGWSLVVP